MRPLSNKRKCEKVRREKKTRLLPCAKPHSCAYTVSRLTPCHAAGPLLLQYFCLLQFPTSIIGQTEILKSSWTTQVQTPFHSLWRAWFLRIFARVKADNSMYSVASLRKLVNAPPSHNPPMRNKTWQLTMLSRRMKRLQTATTTYIYNGPEGILVGC
jgi:hypothetical protein